MSNHYNPSQGSVHGGQLRNALVNLETGHVGLARQVATMTQMLNGDGSDAAHFDEVAENYGYGSTAIAKAAYEELNSANAKLQTDGSVSSVLAALNQLFARFR
jgi:hypothetical protein